MAKISPDLKFLTVSAALPLSGLIVGVGYVTSVPGKVSLIRVFSFGLFEINM